MRYCYIPIRMAKVKNIDNMKSWWRCRGTRFLILCWWECKYYTATLEDRLAISYKIKHTFAIRPNWLRLSNYPGEIETYDKTYTWMFIATFFVVAPNWSQPKYHSVVNGWRNCGISIQRNATQQWKEMNYLFTQHLGWISEELC